VHPESVESISSAMVRLIEDPALRERLGANALERAAQFGERESLPRIEALYDAVTAGPQEGPSGEVEGK
jgi:glycosyltransferase involved in cell wall biosynthesis